MEESDLLKMAGVSSTGVAIVLLVYRILKTVQGKTFISKCCGRKMDIGFTVREGDTPRVTDNPMIITVKQSPDREDGHPRSAIRTGEKDSTLGSSSVPSETVFVAQTENKGV